jgi:hypothetical protein
LPADDAPGDSWPSWNSGMIAPGRVDPSAADAPTAADAALRRGGTASVNGD